MQSLEHEFKEASQLAKSLELKWFEFYSPNTSESRRKKISFLRATSDRNNVERYHYKKALRGEHCMPFLRRNLSYIRDEPHGAIKSTPIPFKVIKEKNNLHVSSLESKTYEASRLVSEDSNPSKMSMSIPTQTQEAQNDLQQNLFSASQIELDESEVVDVTMESYSDESFSGNQHEHKIIVTDSATTPNVSKLEHILSSINCKSNENRSKQSSVSVSLSSEHRKCNPLYDQVTMGPPKEFKSHFALFSKFNREKIRKLLPMEKQKNKYEIRRQALQMWSKLSHSEIDFWSQQHELDRQRFLLQRKMYFYSLSCDHVKSSKKRRSHISCSRSSSRCREVLQNIRNKNKIAKTFYHYKCMERTNVPVLHTEMRKDFKCPFCFFLSNSYKGQIIHLKTFHHDLCFDCGFDEETNLHISVSQNPEKLNRSKSDDLREHLNNFTFVGEKAMCKQVNNNQFEKEQQKCIGSVSYVKRPHVAAANMDLASRRKKIRLLKESGADNETISKFVRSSQIPLRQYYHTRTNLPMQKDDWNNDSDEDSDDDWFRNHKREVTYEFEDVSEKEKEFMIYWNEFIQTNVIIPDSSLPRKCIEFVETHGNKIIERDLRHQLLVHLFNIWDNGLISSSTITQCMGLFSSSLGKAKTREFLKITK